MRSVCIKSNHRQALWTSSWTGTQASLHFNRIDRGRRQCIPAPEGARELTSRKGVGCCELSASASPARSLAAAASRAGGAGAGEPPAGLLEPGVAAAGAARGGGGRALWRVEIAASLAPHPNLQSSGGGSLNDEWPRSERREELGQNHACPLHTCLVV